MKLKQEIIRLKKWQILAIKNSRENVAYKKLLNSTSDYINIIKTALVTSQTPNIYAKTAIINAGYKDNIKDRNIEKSNILVNNRRLVGGKNLVPLRRLVKNIKYFFLHFIAQIKSLFRNILS